jgi:hypothetical protein
MTTNVCQSAMGGLVKKNKRHLQVYTMDIYTRKRELEIPKRDLVTDDSMQLATYVKTSD